MKLYKYPYTAQQIMGQTNEDFSTQKISPKLLSQIVDALKNKAYGSIEIFIENYNVTQITERTITKLSKNNSAKVPNQQNVSQKSKFTSNLPPNQ